MIRSWARRVDGGYIRRMRRIVLPILLLLACSTSETTPAGPVGKATDLRSRINKPEVAARAPSDEQAVRHEHELDLQGAKAKLVWRTFEDGGTKYIVSAGWEVVTPAKGIKIEPLGVLNPENAGSVEAPVQSEIVRVRWSTKSGCSQRSGERSVKIDASGAATAI
jgi:hypothetical protein